MFNINIINKEIMGEGFDSIIIDQDNVHYNIIRISWFKDNHFQGELYLDVATKKFHNPDLRSRQDWYWVGEGVDIDIYFSFNNTSFFFR